MEEIEAYHLNWLWTARRSDGQGSWEAITHADDERSGKTACGMDSSKGWWDGSGENITKAAPSCLKCCKALAKRGIVHNPNRIIGGMVVVQSAV